jgi:hypothetical protein
MAEKKASKKSKAKTKAKAAKKPAKKKAAPKKAKARKKAAKKSSGRTARTAGLDKSVEEFRSSLERNVTLSRDRLQEVVDDAVKRGRMTRGDAEKMLSDMIKRGRRQTDSLLKELERLVKQARRAAKKLGLACSWTSSSWISTRSPSAGGGWRAPRGSSSSSRVPCPGTACGRR